MSIIEKAVNRMGKRDVATDAHSQTSSSDKLEVSALDKKGTYEASLITKSHATSGSESFLRKSIQEQDSAVSADSGITNPLKVEIDLARLGRNGFITPDSGRTAIFEEFRHIKRPLIQNAFSNQNGTRHSNLILVTSALPGEGKTFCAINLAMSISMELDHTVLLIDADVARSSIPRYMGVEADRGLLDVLQDDDLDISQVMLNTNVERLRLLPSGKGHKRATELLASQSMEKFLDEIANRYPDRIVIFDSPPILLTSEARVLASKMGQIVMVVAAESTTQHDVKEAINRISGSGNINLIYNKTKPFPGMGDYGTYY